MPEDNYTLRELSIKFGEKNPLFVRIVMEHHHTDHKKLKTAQGKIIEWEYEAHAKRKE